MALKNDEKMMMTRMAKKLDTGDYDSARPACPEPRGGGGRRAKPLLQYSMKDWMKELRDGCWNASPKPPVAQRAGGITRKSGTKNCVGIHDPMPKSSSDDPKQPFFIFFWFFWPRPGKGLNPKALYLRPLPFSRIIWFWESKALENVPYYRTINLSRTGR